MTRDYEYGGWSAKSIQKIWKIVDDNPEISTLDEAIQKTAEKYSEETAYNAEPILRNALIAKKYGDEFSLEEREFYRIGEPREGYGEYLNSYNFANDKPEHGVSVMTPEWLNSFKSTFFGVGDEKIKEVGIWKIKGVKIAEGGDGEPLIYPTDWAERTDYTSVDDWYNDFKNEKF